MLLIDSNAPEDRQKAIVGDVEKMLGDGGTIVGSHDWGSRRVAFEIDHRPEAAYQLFQFEGDNALLDRLNHSLKIMDDVLRFRIIRQLPGGPPVPPSPDPIRAARPEEPEGRVAARAAADAAPEPEPEPEALRRGHRGARGRRASRAGRSHRGVTGSGARRDHLGRRLASLPAPVQTLLRLAFVAVRVTAGPRSFLTYLRLSRIRRHVGSGGQVVRMRLRPLGGRSVRLRPSTSDVDTVWGTFAGHYHLPPPEAGTPRLVWDLGANIGLTMADIAQRHPRARIVGVELDSENAALARANLEPWGERCEVIEAAVWPHDGDIRYLRLDGVTSGHHVTGAQLGDDPGVTPVHAISPWSLLALDGAERGGRLREDRRRGRRAGAAARERRLDQPRAHRERRGARAIHRRGVQRGPPGARLPDAGGPAPLGLRHRGPRHRSRT